METNGFTDFLKAVAPFIWCLNGVSISHTDLTINCDQIPVSWIGHQPTTNAFSFCFMLNSTVLHFKCTVCGPTLTYQINSMNLLPSRGFVMFGSEPCLNTFSSNFIEITPNSFNTFYFRLDQTYKLQTRDQNTCQLDGHKFDCVAKCFIDTIWQQCQCKPLLAAFYSLTEKCDRHFCAFNTSSDSCMTNKPINMSMCEERCKQMCLNTFISFSLRDAPIADNITSMRLRTDSFIYPIFSETWQIQPKQFLAQLGGNLSFWIGASFLALLHIVVSLVRVPFSYQRSSSSIIVTSGCWDCYLSINRYTAKIIFYNYFVNIN